MFALLSCMRNLRQGHDRQGKLKEVDNNPSYRNLNDYYAPDDVKSWTEQLKAQEQRTEKDPTRGQRVWESFDTKPGPTTYLTPEWDETIPFPNSKILGSHISEV